MKIAAWLEKNTTSLVGKTVAVTGSTGGLGKELCHYLAACGADLVLLDRNAEKSKALREELTATYGVSVRGITVDLENMDTVKAATEQLKRECPQVFFHNAGAYSIPRKTCDTGYDNVFQINFVSPYYMICQLLPSLREVGGRVVVVGSVAHTYSETDPDDVDFSSRTAASKVYGNAKRYLMFALHELFRDERDVSLAVTHPGITFTNITAHYPPLIFAVIKHPMKVIFMKPRKAALSIVRGVFEPCGYREWIGPRWFGVWGMPKKTVLRTCSDEECRRIGDTASAIVSAL
ncbi:MAG: SDR family NAD(P)-dependent oxidoreductase [Clostridia bacterium]|nr:SDR family NAD(P)-dependent oxidoreductase [Clostridia bacterium]